MFDPLIQHGYRIMFYEASNTKEWIKAFKAGTENQQGSLLIVTGHGSEDYWNDLDRVELGFGMPGRLLLSDEKQLKGAGISGGLLPEAQIIIESCSAGKGREGRNNIANMFRRIFPQAAKKGIWAATKPGSVYKLIFDEQNRLKEVIYSYGGEYLGGGPDAYRASLDFPQGQNVQPLPFQSFISTASLGIVGPLLVILGIINRRIKLQQEGTSNQSVSSLIVPTQPANSPPTRLIRPPEAIREAL